MSAPSRSKIRPPREGEAPAAAALVIGAYLRAVRLARGLTGSEAAGTIGCSAARLSRVETGRLHWTADATDLLERYGIDDLPSLTAVEYLLQGPHRHILSDHAPGWLDRLHACLRQAETVVIYSAFSIPHMVRIPTYPTDSLTQRLRGGPVRVRHAQVTVDNGEGVTLVVDELALERLLSQPSVWSAQLSHLRQLASSPQGPRMLVLPLDVGMIPPASLMYGMTLHGHVMVAEEGIGFVSYYTGDEAAQRCHFLSAALDAGLPFEQAVVGRTA
ncbi:Scr1 family TA system antitoxin-like transcriptional regulator [Streptomyces sp. NEAU-YJ-81]|uniref:Scr1 family TA system antitoxin-like transcriptional regulator n=1 Tax=Streptomyces sp. NEAU-YJ-81 TaxID=2820288 RepID=UPI001ABD45C0|nr:Scr1 family TA system antitoxin-like transcriptional regulator [Streptomyces sp. NEAU-YJ-81]MBO3682716.1 helix-turn-helix domain-containing protein [Streptomyces sp. NEAU-YJ-81]